MLLDDLLTEPETATLPDLNDGLPCDPRPVFALDFSGCGYAVSYACATRGGEYLPPVTGVLGPASVAFAAWCASGPSAAEQEAVRQATLAQDVADWTASVLWLCAHAGLDEAQTAEVLEDALAGRPFRHAERIRGVSASGRLIGCIGSKRVLPPSSPGSRPVKLPLSSRSRSAVGLRGAEVGERGVPVAGRATLDEVAPD